VEGRCTDSCDGTPATARGTSVGSDDGLRTLEVAIELPNEGRWLQLAVDESAHALVGCETEDPAIPCAQPHVRTLDAAAQRELASLWSAFVHRPGCRVRIDESGWVRVRLAWSGGSFEARYPEDTSALAPAECFTAQHLAGWFVRQPRPAG
jgi:hypothetical protein